MPELSGLKQKQVEQILAKAPAPEIRTADPTAVATIQGLDVRLLEHRADLLTVYGGDTRTEAAVYYALKGWPTCRHPDGSWSYDLQSGKLRGQAVPGAGTMNDINGATAVVLLPFLGAGNTHRTGKYKQTVAMGLRFLGTRVKPTATGANYAYEEDEMYSQAFVALAIAEAYAMTEIGNCIRRPSKRWNISSMCNHRKTAVGLERLANGGIPYRGRPG